MKGSVAAAALLSLVVLPAAYGQEQIDGANDLFDSVSAENPPTVNENINCRCSLLTIAYDDDSCKRYYLQGGLVGGLGWLSASAAFDLIFNSYTGHDRST